MIWFGTLDFLGQFKLLGENHPWYYVYKNGNISVFFVSMFLFRMPDDIFECLLFQPKHRKKLTRAPCFLDSTHFHWSRWVQTMIPGCQFLNLQVISQKPNTNKLAINIHSSCNSMTLGRNDLQENLLTLRWLRDPLMATGFFTEEHDEFRKGLRKSNCRIIQADMKRIKQIGSR